MKGVPMSVHVHRHIRAALLVALALCALCCRCAPAEGIPYEERAVNVYRESLNDSDTVALRFYGDMSSVPWMGIRAYYRAFLEDELRFSMSDDHTARLTQSDGTWAEIDLNAGTLYTNNLSMFKYPPEFKVEGMSSVTGNMPAFLRAVAYEYDRLVTPVSVSLARYGIHPRLDGQDVYFPLATLSDLFSTYELRYVSWNGEAVYYTDAADFYHFESPRDADAHYFDPIFRYPNRPADMAEFAYNEICFNIDTFYGFPGAGQYEEAIAQYGLDAALQKHDPTTRRLLKSTKSGEYVAGLVRLFNGFLNDHGHTGFMEFEALYDHDYPASAAFALIGTLYALPTMTGQDEVLEGLMQAGAAQLKAQGVNAGTEVPEEDRHFVVNGMLSVAGLPVELPRLAYVEQGDTAIYSPANFSVDYDAWDAYYLEGGPCPLENDTLGSFLDALDRASRNPEIRNFVLDLSTNLGGDSAAEMAMLQLMTGQCYADWLDRLTGQRVKALAEADLNLDGRFDDADRDLSYDFRYAVIVSRGTFSAGNMMAFQLKDCGIPVIGETSGGGACPIQICTTADGLAYQMSCQLTLLDAQGDSVEGGVAPDIPLVFEDEKGNRSYDGLYDPDLISRVIDDWYAHLEARNAA